MESNFLAIVGCKCYKLDVSSFKLHFGCSKIIQLSGLEVQALYLLMNVNCVYWLKSWGAAGKLEGPYNRRRLKHPYTFKSAATESNPWIKAYC